MIKSLRRTLALAFAGAVLASCTAGGGSGAVPGTNSVTLTNPNVVLHSLSFPDSTPVIKSVTPIQAEQTQNIIIKGSGFGKMKPYNGDSCCIQIVVTNVGSCPSSTWQAGYEGSGNEVTLNVKKWANKKIIITGFTGYYGEFYCWYLVSGQPIKINVWNAKTQSGPASWSGTVQ